MMTERTNDGSKRAYTKPEIKTEKIHRFFFAMCQTMWPMCYSQHVFSSGMYRCRG